MDTLTRILAFLLMVTLGSGLRIETTSKTYDQRKQTDVILECVLEGNYNAMANPLSWDKMQQSNDTVGVEVAEGVIIRQPFDEDKDRIKILYTTNNGKHHYNLHIKQLRPADSGKYRCKLDSQSGVLDSITHTLNVIAPVTSVEIVGQATPLLGNETLSYSPELTYHQGKTGGYLACTATGGYPKPTITVKMGNETSMRLITPKLDKTKTEEALTPGTAGLQEMQYTVKRWTESFKVGVHDTQLTCEATSHPDLKSASQTVHLSLYSKPAFTNCQKSRSVEEGTKQFDLLCVFRSTPMFDGVEWTVGDVTIPNQKKVKSFKSSVEAGEDPNTFKASLVVDEVTSDMFGKTFVLTVTNKAGTSTTSITLQKGTQTVIDNGSGASIPGASVFTVCSLLGLLVYCKNQL